MWGLKTTTVPVVMGALGTIKKDMENYSNKIPGNINIHELQKITLLSIKQEPSFSPKVHGLDSDVERENQSQLLQYILYNNNNDNNNYSNSNNNDNNNSNNNNDNNNVT